MKEHINYSQKKLFFLSASDRINYGDLLFPILFKKLLDKYGYNIPFNNVGVVRSDLSSYGALPTISYKDMEGQINLFNSVIVVGGGEVFFADWPQIYSFINPICRFFLSNSWIKRIDKKFNITRQFLSNGNSPFPFVPDYKGLVVFQSVGGGYFGSDEKCRSYIVENLRRSALLTVRDKRTCRNLKRIGIDSKVMPDSAIVISDMFLVDELNNYSSIAIPGNRYFFLQIGKNKSPDNADIFISKLLALAKKNKLIIVCSPIGKAPGHDDDDYLLGLSRKFTELVYIEPKSIYDTLKFIVNSEAYFGTSLHGAITSFSYGIPFIMLNKRLSKMDGYRQTWMSKLPNMCLGFEEVELAEEILSSWPHNLAAKLIEEQKKLAYGNFLKLMDIVTTQLSESH